MTQNDKTILILGESSDQSTSQVMDWIVFYGATPLRINEYPKIKIKKIHISNTSDDSYVIEINGKEVRSDDIYSYWYRRGYFTLLAPLPDLKELDKDVQHELNYHLNQEIKILEKGIHKINESKRSIGAFDTNSMNKLEVLMIAKRLGITIPETYVITHKKQFNDTGSKQKYITKAISEALTFHKKKEDFTESYVSYTEEVNDMESHTQFFPSLIQEKLDKHYELRIFYMHGEFYSMAIFSQNDSKTETDFRKYNNEKPNRNVPFSLPKEEAEKLHLLMIELGLNTGSIDMVVTKDKQYVFLEVNPVGQFGMVSNPCHYKLEKRIAKYLTVHD
mgnify:CR=1 FL=1